NFSRPFGEFLGFLAEERRVRGFLLEGRRRLNRGVRLLVGFANSGRNGSAPLATISRRQKHQPACKE
ncbi:MAG: hypothetical protein DMG40_03505, partial [Acidobacteria bacterium]